MADYYTMESFQKLTSTLGAGLALYLTYRLLDTAWLYTRPSNLSRYLYPSTITSSSSDSRHHHNHYQQQQQKQHAWALVTGSSNGIGKSLAFELASHGFNVVLHGRNGPKLEGVRDELTAMYPDVETRILVADASQCHRLIETTGGSAFFEESVRSHLGGLNLTVLINCAGAGPQPSFGALETYTPTQILENLHLNAVFPALLTAAVLPIMKSPGRGQGRGRGRGGNQGSEKEKEREKGMVGTPPPPPPPPPLKMLKQKQKQKRAILVMNIGSVTDAGFPLVSFYSAGKASTHALHKALALETLYPDEDEEKEKNNEREEEEEFEVELEVISHRVGHVTAVSHSDAPPSLFQPHARTIAKAVLARTGCGRTSVVPYWPHALQQVFLGCVPAWWRDRVVAFAMSMQKRAQDDEMARVDEEKKKKKTKKR